MYKQPDKRLICLLNVRIELLIEQGKMGRCKMKAKRLLSLVLSAVICMTTAVCVMPTDVRAADPVVKVGGEEVTSYNNPTESKSNKYSGKVTYNDGTLA